MKCGEWRKQLLGQIELEKEKKVFLEKRKEQLEGGIFKLLSDSTVLLRSKLEELEIPGEGATADTLLSEVSELLLQGVNDRSGTRDYQHFLF
jgi:hypothetical protein